jgi:hypothetical protein
MLMKLVFSVQGLQNAELLNLIKVRPMGAELFHADGPTEGQK